MSVSLFFSSTATSLLFLSPIIFFVTNFPSPPHFRHVCSPELFEAYLRVWYSIGNCNLEIYSYSFGPMELRTNEPSEYLSVSFISYISRRSNLSIIELPRWCNGNRTRLGVCIIIGLFRGLC